MQTVNYDINVVEAAEKRIVDAFNKNKTICLSFSGGKDSICLSDMVIKTMQKYGIAFNRLLVIFFDEEAIYPDVEQIVLQWRSKFMALGAKFYWFCLPIRHYNCCNQLANDETFICWEQGKQAQWIRPMPKFAIRQHAKFKAGMSYQEFSKCVFKSVGLMVGLRISESIQRRSAVGAMKGSNFIYPIYDWRDKDIWLYIQRNNLQIPQTYISLYKCGVQLNKLRISQFFSIDTIKTLPKLMEFYPDLYEAVLRREPNADLVMLYWDTDMFRSSRQDRAFGQEAEKDYEAMFKEAMKQAAEHPDMYAGYRPAKQLYSRCTSKVTQKTWHKMYQLLIAGDPKRRSYRVIIGDICHDNTK